MLKVPASIARVIDGIKYGLKIFIAVCEVLFEVAKVYLIPLACLIGAIIVLSVVALIVKIKHKKARKKEEEDEDGSYGTSSDSSASDESREAQYGRHRPSPKERREAKLRRKAEEAQREKERARRAEEEARQAEEDAKRKEALEKAQYVEKLAELKSKASSAISLASTSLNEAMQLRMEAKARPRDTILKDAVKNELVSRTTPAMKGAGDAVEAYLAHKKEGATPEKDTVKDSAKAKK